MALDEGTLRAGAALFGLEPADLACLGGIDGSIYE